MAMLQHDDEITEGTWTRTKALEARRKARILGT